MSWRWVVVTAPLAALPYACSSTSPDGAASAGDGGSEPDATLCAELEADAVDAMAAAERTGRAADAACSSNADCTVSDTASCGGGCAQYGLAGGPAQVAIVEAEAKKQNATTCATFFDAGCRLPAPCPGPPPPPIACIAGACRSPYSTWLFFEFVEPTTDRVVDADGGITGTNPQRSSTLSRADYDVGDAIMADASFTEHPSLGCVPPPVDAGTITFRSKTLAQVGGSGDPTVVDATGCVLGDAGNDIKTLYGIVAKY